MSFNFRNHSVLRPAALLLKAFEHITYVTYSWFRSSTADRINASHTIQSLNPDSESWPDWSLVLARLSNDLVVSYSSCHFAAFSKRFNLNLHSCHSPFATADSGPSVGSLINSNRCSGFPRASVTLCRRSNSCGVCSDRIGSFFGSCRDRVNFAHWGRKGASTYCGLFGRSC